jgi:alpha-galactosidase
MVKTVAPDGSITYSEGTVPENEFAFNAAYTMASGGMVLSGDDVGDLTPKNIALLKKLLPPTGVAAEFDDNKNTLGRAAINEQKTILYAFNLEEEEKDVSWQINGEVDVLDLFEDKHLGRFAGTVTFPALPPHSAKVLVCTKKG